MSVEKMVDPQASQEKKKNSKCSGRNMVWLFVVFGGVTGVIVHLAIQTYFYLEDQRFVDLFLGEMAFEFPEMTFCRMHRFNKNKRTKLSYQINENRSVTYYQIQDRTKAFWELMNLREDEDISALVDRSLRATAFDYDLYEPAMAEILDCKWNERKCGHVDFALEKHPKFFQCFAFTVNESQSDTQNRDFTRGLQAFFANFGKYSDSSQLKNIEEEPMTYMVSLHERGTRPDFVKQTVFLSNYNLNMVDIDEKVFVKLNHRDYPCIDNRGNVTYMVDFSSKETKTFKARYEDCIIERTQTYLLQHCGCLDSEMYVPESMANEPLCDTLGPKYLYFESNKNPPDRLNPEIDILTEAYKDGIIQRHRCYVNTSNYLKENPEAMGRCLPDCITKVYTFSKQSEEVSSYRYRLYRSKYFDEKKLEFPDFNDRDYGSSYPVYTKLFSSKGTATVLTEKWAYTLKSYLSDVGGILGLWIGVSFVTLFEIVDRFLNQYKKTNEKVKLRREATRRTKAAAVESQNEKKEAAD